MSDDTIYRVLESTLRWAIYVTLLAACGVIWAMAAREVRAVWRKRKPK